MERAVMPSRGLPLLALALIGVAPSNGTFAQAPPPASSPVPEVIPAPTDLKPNPPTETLAGITSAGPCESLLPIVESRPWYEPDTFQFLSGYSFRNGLGPTVPRFDYVPITTRWGWYLTDPIAPGAISFLFGATNGIVTESFGHYFAGPSIGFRYERRPDRDLVPYFQIGSGLAFNDGWKDPNQRAIGSSFEFCDQFELGVRWRIAGNWSLDAEAAYMHISNAGFASRNLGVNNLGLMMGFTYVIGKSN
jgi:lipid A 3-O-deacylase